LEDISDDDSDPFDSEEEEEEDSDLEGFEEDDEISSNLQEEDSTMSTPSKKKRTPRKSTPVVSSSDTVKDLTSSISRMKVFESFSLDYKLPYIITDYKEGLDDMCNVEILVPTLPKDFFVPDVSDGGKELEVSMKVPPFFVNENRVLQTNQGDGFNQNTHQAQAFKTQCQDINNRFTTRDNIFGKPMIVKLPFVCEERIQRWEIQAYVNDLGTLTDDLGGQQFHSVLSVTLMKLKSKRRTEGGFRIVGA
jgi:hypothetical protein